MSSVLRTPGHQTEEVSLHSEGWALCFRSTQLFGVCGQGSAGEMSKLILDDEVFG